MNPFIIPAAISAGGAILGGLLGKSDPAKMPNPPEYEWVKRYGPGIWNQLKDRGYSWMDNPYGLGPLGQQMKSSARMGAATQFAGAGRDIAQRMSQQGMSPVGGTANRQAYYGRQGFQENLFNQELQIDKMEYLAQEEQRNRGMNLLLSLSSRNPAYAQIAAQNYWNELNYANQQNMMMAQGIGGAANAAAQYYAMSKMPQYNPANYYYNPYSFFDQNTQNPALSYTLPTGYTEQDLMYPTSVNTPLQAPSLPLP